MPDESIKLEYNILKRKLFDRYYSHLNKEQRECVYTVSGPLMILAGAGSGKTTVLVNRLSHIVRYGDAYYNDWVPDNTAKADLIEMNNAMSLDREALGEYLTKFSIMPPPAWAVLAVTFTNKAANEIKERVEKSFGENSDEAKDMWTGTFHSVCMRILRRWGELLGYEKGFGIADSDDQKKLVAECMKELNIDTKLLPVKSVISEISNAKNHLMTPSEYRDEFYKDVRHKKIADIYGIYQKRLRASNLLDFDDIIMQTVVLIENFEEVRNNLQNRFRFICIDEYQDTNHAQFRLVSLLSDFYRNLMVVGDDDQSIYKFRGATIENILTFDKTYPNAKVIRLEQNYRSTKTILEAANKVIAMNRERKGKNLWTNGDDGEKIQIIKLTNQLQEAKYISDTVSSMHEDGNKFSSFAVLYRTNSMSRAIEQALAKSGIPYRMLGSLRFFDRLEIKDILSYISVINNPNNSIALRRIINVPRRGIGDKSISAAAEIAEAEGVTLFTVMGKADSYKAIPSAAAKSMMALVSFFEEMTAEAQKIKISSLIEKVAVASGYHQMLVAAGEAEKDRIDNIGELVSTAAQYEESTETPSLSEFLEDVALVSDVDRYDESADAVILMTIHSAKGLEFENVFLPGWEEGVFPGYQSIMNPEEIEEERRLAYVAITRAKKRLFITHVKERMMNGSTQYNQKSRFLNDIPEKLTDDCDKTYSSYSAYGDSYNYGYGKKMPARAGDMPIYNHSGPGGGWGMGEERAAYTGNVPSTGFSRQKSLSKTVPKAPGASP
ncbi:MAG: 3'-5' exonuclease, partial [Clostridia bacterium]|nr:3'-5' exonuclease [Clostridia bacterium]